MASDAAISSGTLAFAQAAGAVEKFLAHRAVQTAATVAALLWLCWALAQGTWRVFQPASPPVARAGGAESSDLRALADAHPFGRSPARGPVSEARVAPTNLNITLTGVLMRPSGGCALLLVQGQPESVFCARDEVTPGVRLDTVQRDRVVIVRNGVREAVLMKDADPAVVVMGAPAPIVQSMGADRQVVDRRQLQKQLGQPEFLSQALIVPNPGGGFLVRQIQSGSLYEKLGLKPGDIIRNVNGQPLTNMDDVMRLYQQFGSAQRVLVDVQRQGRSETLYYDMR
ncbi:MAG TPA: type II secretion system protein N [Burkholderiales bacterium]